MQVTVKRTNPTEDFLREELMRGINDLSFSEMKNLKKLFNSSKARKLLSSSVKVNLIT